jgi:hypothetical protein
MLGYRFQQVLILVETPTSRAIGSQKTNLLQMGYLEKYYLRKRAAISETFPAE